MKRFKELLQLAKRNGIFVMDIQDGGKIRPALLQRLIDVAQVCEVFVFSSAIGWDTELSDENAQKLDAPFPVFSIEAVGSDPLMSCTFADVGDGHGIKIVDVWCLIIVERSGEIDCDYFSLVTGRGREREPVVSFHRGDMFHEGVALYLERLGAEACGVEDVHDGVVQMRSADGKKKRTVSRPRMFVVCKPQQRTAKEYTSRKIDWSHRFSVRGHWVRLASPTAIGKDREGNYAERGRTWRIAHVKGPEDKPLFQKTRIVPES